MSERSKNFFTAEANHHYAAKPTSWPEWKDSDLNNEKWGTPKDELFLDAEPVRMPRSLEPSQWLRAKDLEYMTDPLTVYASNDKSPDLISNNKHLLHSEFMRWFISSIMNLQYYGREGLEISGESANFVWVNRHEPWHGWMHVYSLNKAGRGVPHQPMINPNGKYIVRLHHIGYWRRIVVDDTIPVDQNGTPLLPRTSNNTELWPMLLAKALLKISSLTWTKHSEIVDFHLISCLTGWTCLTLNIAHLSWQDKWDFLTKYSDHFVWSPRIVEDQVPKSSESVRNNIKPNEALRLLAQTGKPQPITLFLQLRNMRELGNDVIPGLSPCWDHVIYVVQSRDIPLDPKDVKPPLERWKLHRWLKWAISRGIIDPADYFVPIRYLRVISPLQKYNKRVIHVHDDVKNNSTLPNEIKQSNNAKRNTKSQKEGNSCSTTKDEETGDISRWIDFNKMAPYVTEVYLFYKLEYFQCSIQVINETIKLDDKDRKATITNESKKEKEDNSDRSYKVQKSRYKPLYLFCDSLKKKFFLISLCAAPNKENKNSYKRDYLILEKHNWFFEASESDQLVIIRTTGTKSTVVEMEAGRQLLQIDGSPEFSLVIISSDTAFHLGNKTAVQQLMTTESDRIEQMSKMISDSLRKAYQSFGTEDYSILLREYYQSYMPNLQNATSEEDKKFLRMLIHNFFMEEQVRLIMETFPTKEHESILNSMRVFFLNPNIRLEYFNLIQTQNGSQDLVTKQMSKISYFHKPDGEILDQAATKIQSFFKMALIKQYKYLHNSDHAQHMQIREELLKISNIFDSSMTSQLLRNIIKRHDKLYDLYPCSKDFVHVLNFQEFKGALENIEYDKWFPIARIIVNPRSFETVFAAFELLVDLPCFTLRVFNNQNHREMTRLINRVTPGRYGYQPTGYTVFAYGWSGKQRFKEIDWTIRIITMKGEPIFYQLSEQWIPSLETKPPNLMVEELAAIYIPNARNCISRWILQAISGSIISIRLTTSYNMVKVRVTLTDEESNVLLNIDGGSTILLPLVILDQPTDIQNHHEVKNGSVDVNEESAMKKKKLYYMEAFVLNNSWSLTDVEWTVVNQIKDRENLRTKMQFENKISSAPNLLTTRKDTKQSVNNSQVLESPYWILQVVTSAKYAVKICQDKRREQEIAQLKESWWSKDLSRSERGKKLREMFLNMHALKTEAVIFSEQNEEGPNAIETEDITFCQLHEKQRRTLKPPESYYLPTLDLTKYMTRKEIVTDYYVRRESDYQILRDQQSLNIINSQKNYSHYLENLAKLINEQLRRYTKLFDKKEKNFWERRALVDDAYKSRKVYIDTLIPSKAKIKKNKTKN